jgi:hypothetical protein
LNDESVIHPGDCDDPIIISKYLQEITLWVL